MSAVVNVVALQGFLVSGRRDGRGRFVPVPVPVGAGPLVRPPPVVAPLVVAVRALGVEVGGRLGAAGVVRVELAVTLARWVSVAPVSPAAVALVGELRSVLGELGLEVAGGSDVDGPEGSWLDGLAAAEVRDAAPP